MHNKTREWRRKKDRELAKCERDLKIRSDAVEEKSTEVDAIIEITEAIGQGVVDPTATEAGGKIIPVKGRENDEAFLGRSDLQSALQKVHPA